MKPKGTRNVGSVVCAFELPRFLESSRQTRQWWGKFLHVQPQAVIGLPLENLLDMTRPVPVRDSDSRTNNAGRLDIRLRNFDARYRAVPVEVRPLRQVENLPGDVFGSERKCFFAGEGDWVHLDSFAVSDEAVVEFGERVRRIIQEIGVNPTSRLPFASRCARG